MTLQTHGLAPIPAMHRIRVHALAAAALAGAAAGLLTAVLLLRMDVRMAGHTFAVVALPARWWHGYLFGWVWPGSDASELLAILPANGALWAVALTALVRRLRRSARARRIALGSALAGTAPALGVWRVGLPIFERPGGLEGVVFDLQLPGMMLLAINGYDGHLYDGSVVGRQFHPGPLTLLLLAGANTLLIALLVLASGFWLRLAGRAFERWKAGAAAVEG